MQRVAWHGLARRKPVAQGGRRDGQDLRALVAVRHPEVSRGFSVHEVREPLGSAGGDVLGGCGEVGVIEDVGVYKVVALTVLYEVRRRRRWIGDGHPGGV